MLTPSGAAYEYDERITRKILEILESNGHLVIRDVRQEQLDKTL